VKQRHVDDDSSCVSVDPAVCLQRLELNDGRFSALKNRNSISTRKIETIRYNIHFLWFDRTQAIPETHLCETPFEHMI